MCSELYFLRFATFFMASPGEIEPDNDEEGLEDIGDCER